MYYEITDFLVFNEAMKRIQLDMYKVSCISVLQIYDKLYKI